MKRKIDKIIDEIKDNAERKCKACKCDEFLWHESQVNWLMEKAYNEGRKCQVDKSSEQGDKHD